MLDMYPALCLAGEALRFLIDDDDEFEPELSRVALLLDPANGASALDAVVLTAQQVNCSAIAIP